MRVQRRQAAVGGVGDVAVLVVVDREMLAGAVELLEAVEGPGELGQSGELRVIRVVRAEPIRGQVDRIRMGGEPGGLKQRGVSGPERSEEHTSELQSRQ